MYSTRTGCVQYTYVRVQVFMGICIYTRLTISSAGLFVFESGGTYVADWFLINWLRRTSTAFSGGSARAIADPEGGERVRR